MKTIRFILAGAILIAFSSFTNAPKTNDALIGTWIYSDSEDEAMSYKKVQSFKEDEGGIAFQSGGKLIKRQNVGWCGTPPIQYGNNDGTWKQTSDSTITISYAYWGGNVEEDWLIVQVSDKKMTIKQLGYRNDYKHLRD
ncbi:MAG: hypothetical protein V4604_06550 [Bacteroidota bacterium]